jgi:glycosyltransferase involved in cell wall biosynthesis
MVVANSVLQDSRVLKTAQTVRKLGYQTTVFGIGVNKEVEAIEGHPFSIILLPNPRYEMMSRGIWPSEKKNIDYEIYTKIIVDQIEQYLICAENKPDILHTHDMVGLAIGGRLLERKSMKPKWIHDIHEYVIGLTEIEENVRAFFAASEEKYIRLPEALTTVSPALGSLLHQHYHLDEKPQTVLNAPRASDYDPCLPLDIRKALNLSADVPLAVYSGNVKPVRGVDILVRALSSMKDLHVAVISNSRGAMEELRALAEDLRVADRLHFHPYVPFNRVTSFLRSATVGVHPIRRYPNAEIALPNKLFEYLHAGLPTIVSSNPTMAEFVAREDAGVAFENDDPDDLAAKLSGTLYHLEKEPGWRRHLTEISGRYTWEQQELVLRDIYSELEGHIPDEGRQDAGGNGMRVLQLPAASAGQPMALAEAMRSQNVTAEALTISQHKFQYSSDINVSVSELHEEKAGSTLHRLAKNYDIFHYHSRPLFFSTHYPHPTGHDLLLLKAAGKSVFYHFRGSEARLASIFAKASLYNYVDDNPDNLFTNYLESEQRKFLAFLKGTVDQIFAVDPEIQCYCPTAPIVPRVINLDAWPNEGCGINPKPIIVHAPSRRGVKGTAEVLEAIHALRDEGFDFEFILVENMPQKEAQKIFKKCDIIIDQLRIGWYGVLAVEGMALGKAVISFIRDDLKHHLSYPLPLAAASPETIKDVLRSLLADRAAMQQLGQRARRYAEDVHDAQQVACQLTQIYSSQPRQVDVAAAHEYIQWQTDTLRESAQRKTKKKMNAETHAKVEIGFIGRVRSFRRHINFTRLKKAKLHKFFFKANRKNIQYSRP